MTDRNLLHISNIKQVVIDQPRELSRSFLGGSHVKWTIQAIALTLIKQLEEGKFFYNHLALLPNNSLPIG